MKKISLQSLITSSLTLNIAIFKNGACQQPCFFHKPRCVYEIYDGKIETSQLLNYVKYWNAQMNPASKIRTVITVK